MPGAPAQSRASARCGSEADADAADADRDGAALDSEMPEDELPDEERSRLLREEAWRGLLARARHALAADLGRARSTLQRANAILAAGQ